ACGSELKAVLATGESAQIDPIGLMELFAYGHPLGVRTLFQGIESLPPASRLVFERGSVHVEQYWELRFSDSPSKASEAELAAELAARLRVAGARQTAGPGRVGLALNGDLGSRVLLETCTAANDSLTCAYSIGYASTREDAASRRPAERFGLRRLFLAPGSGALEAVAPEIVWRSEGSFRFEKACALQFHSRLRPELDVILTSEIASPLCAPDLRAGSLGPALWDPRSPVDPGAQAAAEDVRALCSLRSWSDGWDPSRTGRIGAPGAASGPEDSRDAQVERWMRLGLPHDLLQAAQAARNDFELRAPLLDYDLVDFAARLPGRYRSGQRLLRLALSRQFSGASAPSAQAERRPGLMRTPDDPPSIGRVLELVPGVSRGGDIRGWRAPDLSTELRRDPAFQREILGPFVQSDHFPDEILDRSVARRLLAEHRNGERDHTALLGAMVTVALVYQQFVVRGLQAPTAPRGYPEPVPALEAA
ncbi:MAG: asparagine synthase-related protein, partial [Actinomycetota bacterium]